MNQKKKTAPMYTLNSICKKALLSLMLLYSIGVTNAQSVDELQSINKSASALYVQPETLDQLMIKLRPYFEQPKAETDSLFMATLKVITTNYVANNHFKQGYQVYQQYVRFKEQRLKADLDASVNKANAAVAVRREREDAELGKLQNDEKQLQADIDGYKGKRSAFKTYFSIAIIILSMVVAAMLVSTGVKLNALSNRLKANRDRIKLIHRKAIIGSFSKGLLQSVKSNLDA